MALLCTDDAQSEAKPASAPEQEKAATAETSPRSRQWPALPTPSVDAGDAAGAA